MSRCRITDQYAKRNTEWRWRADQPPIPLSKPGGALDRPPPGLGQSDRSAAQQLLDDWIRRAEASGIRILIRLAHTLAAHRSGILNYYRYRISTGPLEGTNTKIRVLQRKAHGFRDAEFFTLKIYMHETRYELVG
jgi:hypothetical protein